MHQFKLEKFEGPLDLLLQLIEQQKLAITEVSLSQMAEQYLAHLKQTVVGPEDLADFLLVAAKLLYIKSKILIPQLIDEELEDGVSLEIQLRMYKEFVTASKGINGLWQNKNVAFARDRVPVVQAKGFYPPRHLTANKLSQVCQTLIDLLRPILAVPAQAVRRTVSIQEKIGRLKELILQKSHLLFKQWVGSAKDRTEVVVSFLALLEMVKQRHVIAAQDTLFAEIVIDKL